MSDDLKQQFNVYLPAGLVRRVKYASVDAGESLSRLVELALTEYLERHGEHEGSTR